MARAAREATRADLAAEDTAGFSSALHLTVILEVTPAARTGRAEAEKVASFDRKQVAGTLTDKRLAV
jgi:hypothetical protein